MRLTDQMVANFKKIIPAFSSENKKGSYGKSCVIGGSEMYTGAPYHCGMSQLRSVI